MSIKEMYVMIRKHHVIVYVIIFCIFIIAFSGCIQPSTKVTKVTLKEYSNRTDGSRDIRIYQNQNGTVRLTVIKNTNPTDFGVKGLTNEIKYLISNLRENAFEKPLQPYNLDGHTALSMSIIQTYSEGDAVTGVPTDYITVIAYPERNMLMTIRANGKGSAQGDGLTQEEYYEIVNDFKI